VVRDVLDADLRWRDPERYAEMYRRKLTAFHDRVRATADEHEQLELVARMVVLNGARSPLAALSALPPPMRAYADGLRESDRKPVVAMTATWQGTKQAELVAYWMRHRPEAFRTFRTAEGELRGYTASRPADDLGRAAGAGRGDPRGNPVREERLASRRGLEFPGKDIPGRVVTFLDWLRLTGIGLPRRRLADRLSGHGTT
jgi:hypothetical protein